MRLRQVVAGAAIAVASMLGPLQAGAQTWVGWDNVCESFTNVFGHAFGGCATVAMSVAPNSGGGTHVSFEYLITAQNATFFQGTPTLGFAYNAPFWQQSALPSGSTARVIPSSFFQYVMQPVFGEQMQDVFDYPGMISTADILHAQLYDFDWWSNEAARAGLGLPGSQMTFADPTVLAGAPFSTVPEPSTIVLVGIGLAGVAALARRTRRR